jgi:two-component system nitrogen regulation response regulator NtrX
MALVLVVDDVSAMAEQYAYDLHRVGGFETVIATGGKEAIDTIAWQPVDCVILDLEMPGVDGFEVLRTLQKRESTVPVIVYTGTGNFDRCIQAIRLGAYSFIDKSEPMERVVQEVENALERARLTSEVESLRRDSGEDSPMIGSSKPMVELKKQIEKVSGIDSHVLIVGESGTGKELVARELHRIGKGPKAPFVAINSAALPENLSESELFGHERGAFTGANRTHKGAFELASEGTLFLDEIGELPAAAQAKLLRVLEQNEVTRLGAERPTRVNTRVVAATHRDLEADVDEGRFRQDLFYRLNVHILHVPALRERASDIPEITGSFLDVLCARFGIPTRSLTPDALDALMVYDWKRNNIRELRNIIERMIIATDTHTIGVDNVPAEVRGAASPPTAKPTSLRDRKAEAERQIIAAALERNHWHITQTAKELGLSDHASLLKIMRRHNLKQR